MAQLKRIPDELGGSQTFAQKAELIAKKKIIEGMFPHKTNPDMRLKINKQLVELGRRAEKSKKTKGSIKGKKAKSGQRTSRKARRVPLKRGARPNSNKGQRRTPLSPIALRKLLQEVLPETVASKMHSPALNYRTGRFANSVDIKNAVLGSRGGMAVDYTYMKDPYQTFEPGGKQGSTMRDPRKIIGESVREVALKMMGQKFVSVRRV